MKTQHTGIDDRDEWRERITRALKDLRGDKSEAVGRMRREAGDDDAPVESVRF